MTYLTKSFLAPTITDLSTAMNVFLAANPTFVTISVAITDNTGGFFAILAYSQP